MGTASAAPDSGFRRGSLARPRVDFPEEAESASRRRASVARRTSDLLRSAVRSGQVSTGVLPPEDVLVRRLGVSRNALREALDDLRRQGVVVRLKGRGTFVSSRPLTFRRDDRMLGLAQIEHRGEGMVTRSPLAAGIVPATAILAERLEIDLGAEVVLLERLASLDGVPCALITIYLPADLAGGVLGSDLTADLKQSILGALGLVIASSTTTVEATTADVVTASLLEAPPGTPLLVSETVSRLSEGRVIDISFVRAQGSRIVQTFQSGAPAPRA